MVANVVVTSAEELTTGGPRRYLGYKFSFASNTLNPQFASFKANFNLVRLSCPTHSPTNLPPLPPIALLHSACNCPNPTEILC